MIQDAAAFSSVPQQVAHLHKEEAARGIIWRSLYARAEAFPLPPSGTRWLDFISPGNLCRFFEHRRNRAVLILAELNGVPHGLVIQLPAQEVHYFQFFPDGSVARSPEQITSSDSNFCRFFPRMLTMSVAVQAPRATSTSSIGPGAVFEWRSESTLMACPEGLDAANLSSPIHFTDAVCMVSPQLKNNRSNRDARIDT